MSTPLKFTLLSLIVLGSCSCSTLGRGALVAGPAADLTSTQWAKGQGAVEVNPLLQSDAALYASKAGEAAGLLWLDSHIKPSWAKWALRGMAAGAHGWLALHNIREGQKAQQARHAQ